MLDSAIRIDRPSSVIAAIPSLTAGMIAGARDREHLPLAAAQLRALAPRVPPEHREDAVGELDALRGRAPPGPRPRGDLDVLGHGEVGEDPAVLRRPADAELRDLVRPAAVDGLAAELDAARART